MMKDEVLNQLATRANVAQFVSFGPANDFPVRFCRVRGAEGTLPANVEDAIASLLRESPEGMVNVRSFKVDEDKGGPFHYGISELNAAVAHVKTLGKQGYFTIVNETIDVSDGGVSGVVLGGIAEFSPHDTPRCVERPGTCALPYEKASMVLKSVYDFPLELQCDPSERVEFSIHPKRRGFHKKHTIVWEVEPMSFSGTIIRPNWPNRFSRLLGDKAFGLLIADCYGLKVPRTTVLNRNVAPFTFGQATGTSEFWIRTCPVEQMPGKLSTFFGWHDPFQLVAAEDPGNEEDGFGLASVISQEGVEAEYAGGALIDEEGHCVIEGVVGGGVDFMLGKAELCQLPKSVEDDVVQLLRNAEAEIGPVRIEWVHDGSSVWVVQFHNMRGVASGKVIVPGDAENFHEFDVRNGLDELRTLIESLGGSKDGIMLIGEVGITSHFGDLLRRAMIPSRIK